MISPQGYTYGEDPEADNPFWNDDEEADELTATASVDDSTGVPSVDVTKSGHNINFAFKNLKGEKGDKGDQGEQGERGLQGEQGEAGIQGERGETGATGPQGPEGPEGPQGPAGDPGISPAVISTGNTGSGELAGTITGSNGVEISVYNGAKGETGPQGPQGPAGESTGVDVSNLVSDVSVTNENGVYGIQQTKGGVTSDVGVIEVPDIDNVLAEVNDSIVENDADGYDYHTITETEHNGAQNNVGSFYIARKQITELNADGSFKTIDQSGRTGTGQINTSGVSTLNIRSSGDNTIMANKLGILVYNIDVTIYTNTSGTSKRRIPILLDAQNIADIHTWSDLFCISVSDDAFLYCIFNPLLSPTFANLGTMHWVLYGPKTYLNYSEAFFSYVGVLNLS